MRDTNPHFEAAERLYRRIARDDVDGDRILSSAVTVPSCSVNRALYAKPESVLISTRPEFNGIAYTRVGDVVGPFARAEDHVLFEFYVEDSPRDENEAHAEINLRRFGSEFKQKVKGRIREEAKDRLANRFRIHRRPEIIA